MLKTGLGLAASTVMLSACVIVDGEVVRDFDEWDDGARYERVYSASIEDDQINLRVYSTGCTNEAFFEPRINHRGGSDFSVGFKRVRQDYCNLDGVDAQNLTYSFAQLGLPSGADVTIKNPVGRSY